MDVRKELLVSYLRWSQLITHLLVPLILTSLNSPMA